MSNADALAALTRQIALLRTLPDKLMTEAPPIVARVIDAALRETIAAGKDPDGKLWKKTLTGGTPLTGAGQALAVRRVGSGILVELHGPEALHHLGKARGEIVRRVIPVGQLPARIASRVVKALAAKFVQLTQT